MLVCWFSAGRFVPAVTPRSARRTRALADAGIQPCHLTLSLERRPHVIVGDWATWYQIPGFNWLPLRHVVFLAAAPPVLLWLAVRRNVRVVIAQSPYEGAIARVVRAVLRVFGRRLAVVVEAHGDVREANWFYRRVPFPRLTRWLWERMIRFGTRRADGGRAVSAATAAFLRSVSPDLPIEVFPAWIDVAIFDAGERKAPPSSSQIVLFVGGLAPIKGLHVLTEALCRFMPHAPEARVVIAGAEFKEAYTSSLKGTIDTAGISDRVRFAGRLAPGDVAQAMDEARVLVLPSLSEGLGLVVVEAMLRGTPVIGSAVGGIPDVIADGETGWLVPPNDAPALAAALERAFRDTDVDAMGRRGREAARRYLATHDFVSGYRRIIDRLALR